MISKSSRLASSVHDASRKMELQMGCHKRVQFETSTTNDCCMRMGIMVNRRIHHRACMEPPFRLMI
ncbi:hypothetical protein T10_13660 [Trichinella papuae]|uniref:Uncharacterized protein n=1 Tax=Trichinella papuae TaxID=268474 RepID=A0A0V1N357_9BILA|nr:hypothetical protein T10_13660 [Trichinella papuae]